MSKKLIHEPYKKFRGYMRENDITLADLALLLGVTPTTVSFKINGKSDFYLNEFNKIKEHYKIGNEFFL